MKPGYCHPGLRLCAGGWSPRFLPHSWGCVGDILGDSMGPARLTERLSAAQPPRAASIRKSVARVSFWRSFWIFVSSANLLTSSGQSGSLSTPHLLPPPGISMSLGRALACGHHARPVRCVSHGCAPSHPVHPAGTFPSVRHHTAAGPAHLSLAFPFSELFSRRFPAAFPADQPEPLPSQRHPLL